jgi:hypothetical protein
MTFPVIHGLSLASGSSIQNFVIESLTNAPSGSDLLVGRVWYNSTTNEWETGVADSNGVLVVRALTFKDVHDAVDTRVGVLETEAFRHDGSIAMTAAMTFDGNFADGVPDPLNPDQIANKNYVDNKMASLGNAFEYVGVIDATDSAQQDLDALAQKEAGDLYKIVGGGTVTWGAGANSMTVNAGDAIVWNPSGGVDKFDNTNSEVYGTSGEIAIAGSTDIGFTVSIDPTYTATINAAIASAGGAQAELDATQVAAGINDDGSYSPVAGANYIGAATSIKQATQVLDTQIKTNADAAAAEVSARTAQDDVIEAGVGLNTNGTYAPDASSNYMSAATSIHNATQLLDAQVKSNLDAINAEVTTRTSEDTRVETTVTGLVTTEATTRKADDQKIIQFSRDENLAIRSAFNSRMYFFESTVAATTHTIPHNLNTTQILTNVYVYDPDRLSWQRDLVSEVATDNNNYTVELSVPRNIRVVMISCTEIGTTEINQVLPVLAA